MRGVKKTYKRLSLHRHEAPHPPRNNLSRNKESSKLFVITIIGVVLVLALLLSSQGQLAENGFFTDEANTAGTELAAAPVYENQPFSLKVRVNTDKETSTVGFTLNLPQELGCDKVTVKNLLGWDIKADDKCNPVKKQIVFGYATAGTGKSGTFDAAEIDFTGMPKGNYAFTFESFQAFDSQNKNIIQKVLNPVVEVQSAPSEVSSSTASSGGGGAAPTVSAGEEAPTVAADEVASTVPVEEVAPTASAEEAASAIPTKKVLITKAAEVLKAASKKLVAMGKDYFKVAWMAAVVLAVFITAMVIIVYLRRKKKRKSVQREKDSKAAFKKLK